MNFPIFRLAVLAIALPFSCPLAASSSPLPDPLAGLPGDVAPPKPTSAAKPAVSSGSAPMKIATATTTPVAVPLQQPVAIAAMGLAPAPRPIASTSLASPVSAAMQPAGVIPQSVATSVATLRQLDALRSENALLVERVKAAELRAKLPATQPSQHSEAPRQSAAARANDAARAMQVVSVYGLDGNLTAVLRLADNSVVKTHTGSELQGIGTVVAIAHNEVTVKTAGGFVPVTFAPIQSEAR